MIRRNMLEAAGKWKNSQFRNPNLRQFLCQSLSSCSVVLAHSTEGCSPFLRSSSQSSSHGRQATGLRQMKVMWSPSHLTNNTPHIHIETLHSLIHSFIHSLIHSFIHSFRPFL